MLNRKNKSRVLNGVRQARLARGLTERQLAAMTQVEPSTIVAIEEGEYAPSISLALRFAWALDYPVEQLFWLPATLPARRGKPDERSMALSQEVYSVGFGIASLFLLAYVAATDIFQLSTVKTSGWVGDLYLAILFGALFIFSERRARKPFDPFRWVRRLFFGALAIFYITALSYPIGLRVPQIEVILAVIIAVGLLSSVLHRVWRVRRQTPQTSQFSNG